MTVGDPSHELGMEVRREVLGEEYVDASMERTALVLLRPPRNRVP